MLGYADPYGGTGGASVGTAEAAAYYANLRVVRLAGPTIVSIAPSSTNMVMQFSTADGDDTAASFILQSCATVNGTYANVSPAATFYTGQDHRDLPGGLPAERGRPVLPHLAQVSPVH